jgi:glycosyltransferase involved in cell wall biosynthesis
VTHPGWGEALFLKDVFTQAKHIHYFEFYYRSVGADVNFDPEFPSTLDDAFKLRIRNSTQLHALASTDVGVSPTQWQKNQYPAEFASKIQVVHEGVDTHLVCPNEAATFQIGTRVFSAGDQIITYVARNLEPYRGFHVFMRSLPKLLSAQPNAQVVIVGGDEVSYGRRLPPGQTYRALYTQELENQVDWNRVHFLGKVPYRNYLQLLQVSAVHVYLTYPFVLSWSLLEAMSAGCAIVASRTAPVLEVIEDGKQGRLFDFFDTDALVAQVSRVLDDPRASAVMRQQARERVVSHYDLHSICLPQWLKILRLNPS